MLLLLRLSLWFARLVDDLKQAREIRSQIRRERKFCRLVHRLGKVMEEAGQDEDLFPSIHYDGSNLSLKVFDSNTSQYTYVFSYPFSHAISAKPLELPHPDEEEEEEETVS